MPIRPPLPDLRRTARRLGRLSACTSLGLLLVCGDARGDGGDIRPSALTPAQTAQRDAIEHYMRARFFAADGEFESSLKEFRAAVDLEPADGNLRREYAEALRDFGVLPEAEQQARKAVELLPSSPWSHRILGQILMAKARDKAGLEAAVVELKKANESQPGDPVTASALGQALLRLERPEEAAAVLGRVADRGRGLSIPLLYGEALERSDKPDQAEDAYQRVLVADPGNVPATMGLLRVYQTSRRFDKAIPLLKGLLERQPDNLALKTQYGLALLRGRQLAEAGKVFEEVLKADPGNRDALRHYSTYLSENLETDKAEEVLKKLQGLEPDDPDVAFRRAVNFIEARRLDEAETVLKDLKSSLLARKAPARGVASVDGQLAYVALLRKDYAQVRALATPILLDEDGDVNEQALNLLLQAARDSKEPAEGLEVARRALAKDPKSIPFRSSVAEFLLRSSKEPEKKDGEAMLAALQAESREGALAAADAWQRLERYDKAAEYAQKALTTYPDDPDLLFRLGASLERVKKIPEAVAAFEKLLKVKPDHAAGLNYLGYMWADRNENLDRALELIQKAVDLDPSNAAYLDSLGWVYFRRGDLEKAEKYLKIAGALEPTDASLAEHLGDLYEKKGEPEKAREHWRRALALGPEDGGASLKEKLARSEAAAGVQKP